MSPLDGPIGLNLKICNLDTTDVNISKVQPCETNGLGGVEPQRNKSPTIYLLYYKALGILTVVRKWGQN